MACKATWAFLAASCASSVVADEGEQFSTNALCRQNNCINPVFPGMQDLARLSSFQFQCQPAGEVLPHLQFCNGAVNYDVAVPSPAENTTDLRTVLAAQDDAAATMYYYHLAGMKIEPWDYHHPAEADNACVRSVWSMVCHTYFPKAQAGCQRGEPSSHLRPCKNVCSAYVEACGVQCCDESVQCVFEHTVALLEGGEQVTTGYVDELGPAAACTGAASRFASGPRAGLIAVFVALFAPMLPSLSGVKMNRLFAFGVLVAIGLSLQSCSVMGNPTSAWEAKPTYMTTFSFIPPGRPASEAVLNSCHVAGLSQEFQCSGNGRCTDFVGVPDGMYDEPLRLCQCNRDWADPECRTRRKSQVTAFSLSLLFGYLGVDLMYLGFPILGCMKFATLGGCGFWWVLDIVRIGSAPVYAYDYRLAYDLPHWVFVGVVLGFFAGAGALLATVVLTQVQKKQMKSKFLVESERAFHATRSAAVVMNPEDSVGMPTLASYGMPFPAGGYGSAVPEAVKISGDLNPYSPYGVYGKALGWRSSGGPPSMQGSQSFGFQR